MRLEQLEYLAAVVQHGSLRRASEHLHVSQPALSEGVGKLERELGVVLLDRRRSGAQISPAGRELLRHMTDVLDAADRLRAAAGDQSGTSRAVRVGTVSTATASVVAPSIRAFQDRRRTTVVEVLDLPHRQVVDRVVEGALDLGLVNLLEGDDVPPELQGSTLVRGRPVVVLPGAHPLTGRDEITVEELRHERFVAMRSGYAMHRFVQRLFGSEMPATTYRTDGAAMGKLLVADGVGLTVLPDFTVVDDPLERAGLLAVRPLVGNGSTVSLTLLQRRQRAAPEAVRELRECFVRAAAAFRARETGAPPAVVRSVS